LKATNFQCVIIHTYDADATHLNFSEKLANSMWFMHSTVPPQC